MVSSMWDMRTITIYYSDNGGPFTSLGGNNSGSPVRVYVREPVTRSWDWELHFSGTYGHTYGFFSIVADVHGDIGPNEICGMRPPPRSPIGVT